MRTLKPFMRSIHLMLLSALLVTTGKAYSQRYGALPNIMTPEVADLGRYGSFPVSFYSGTPNISIPLYKIKENELDWDISLAYSGGGLMPGKEAGIVGLDWMLLAGGAVTRIVNWSPDDKNGQDDASLNFKSYIGYIQGMKNANLGIYSKDYIRGMSFLTFSGQNTPIYGLNYEYCPDVFNFSFNGHSGTFILGNDGEVKVMSDRKYKVSLTSLAGQNDLCAPNFSEITITADDGYVYKFGGNANALEMSLPFVEDNRYDCKGTINAWHLKSITTRNGRTVTFDYRPQDMEDIREGADHHNLPAAVDYAYEKIFLNHSIDLYTGSQGNNGSNTIGQKFRTILKTCYLSKITTPAGTVDFNYSVKTHGSYGTNELLHHDNKGLQLDNFIVKDYTGTTVKKVSLVYQYYGNTGIGYRPLLDKVNFENPVNSSDKFSYSFNYYNTAGFPNPLTLGLDKDGYYNGMDGNVALIPTATTGPEYNVNFTGRDANAAYAVIGTLQKITYPTGGWSEFIYEGHDYNKKLVKTVAGGNVPSWVTGAGNAGGLRIKEIRESSGLSRKFFYKQNYSEGGTNNTSSGLYIDRNVYFLNLVFYFNGSGNEHYAIVSDNNIAASSSYSETPIGYSEVTEVSNAGGYTKHYFTTHETHPDYYTWPENPIVTRPPTDNSLSNYRQQMLRLITPSSASMERGKLLKTETYDNNNQLKSRIVNTYNTDPDRYKESVVGFTFPHSKNSWYIFNTYSLYYFQTQLTRQDATEFRPDNTIAASRSIIYKYKSNTDPRLIYKSETGSKGEITETRIKYADDFSNNTVLTGMQNAYLLQPVVETIVTKALLPVERTFTEYGSPSAGKYLPYNSQLQVGGNTIETRQLYHAYDAAGNIREMSRANNEREVVIWGYKGQYPVARIVGDITYAQVAPYLNTTLLDNPTDTDVRTMITAVRSAFPACHVTTNTFAPLVGMTSETDARGHTIFYEYDAFKRLKLIKDHNGNILKMYQYQFKQ